MANERILVVDDDDLVRSTLVSWLTVKGFRVAEAGTAVAARGEIARGGFDLVLLDQYLPDVTGVQLVGEVRARDRDVPVFVMSGDSSLDLAMLAIDSGAVTFVAKPIDLETLGSRIILALMTLAERRAARARRPG